MKFRRVFKGERKGKYRKLSSEGFDLRRREAPLFPTDHCTECGIQIPQPWLSPNEDAFLADVLSGDIRAVAAKQEKENGRT